MAGFILWIRNWDLQTIGRWCLIPAALVAALLLPPLLFPLLLTFALVFSQKILSIFSVAAPQHLCADHCIASKPRSPPAC
jgi:hypothetical protein